MARLLYLVLLAMGLSGPVNGQTQTETRIRDCLPLNIDRARLACFDQAAGFTAPEQAVSTARPWQFYEDVDLMTDTETSYVLLSATRQENGRESPGSIVIRCMGEGGYEVFISTQGYIGDRRNSVPVTYRWGDASPTNENGNSSTSGSAAFLPGGYRDFLACLNAGGTLVFAWENFRGSRFTSVWENIGMDENAQYVLNGCNRA